MVPGMRLGSGSTVVSQSSIVAGVSKSTEEELDETPSGIGFGSFYLSFAAGAVQGDDHDGMEKVAEFKFIRYRPNQSPITDH